MHSRADYLKKIETERERQFNLPGSELDIRNTPNEWAAIAGHYLFDEIRRGVNAPDRETYEDSLIKSAAVILAALESVNSMEALGCFGNMNDAKSDLADVLSRVTSKP